MGVTADGGGFSSASIEVYIPVEECGTNGTMVIDGSLGYIGAAREDTRVVFKEGTESWRSRRLPQANA